MLKSNAGTLKGLKFYYKIKDDKPAADSLAALLTLGPCPSAVGEQLATSTLQTKDLFISWICPNIIN